MRPAPEEVAPGVHRVADGLVNWYVVEEDGQVCLVDTGWPRSWPKVQEALQCLGMRVADVHAIVLTHGHPGHLGAAERARRETGAPVRAHAREAARVRGQGRRASPFALVPKLVRQLGPSAARGFVLHAAVHGFMTPRWVTEVLTFDGDSALDVPGRLRPVFTPGHTEGHCAFHLPEPGAVLSGDALVTYDVLTGQTGPRVMPDAVNVDPVQSMASLEGLAGVEAGLLLPGHGDPWAGSMPDAVARAREAASS